MTFLPIAILAFAEAAAAFIFNKQIAAWFDSLGLPLWFTGRIPTRIRLVMVGVLGLAIGGIALLGTISTWNR